MAPFYRGRFLLSCIFAGIVLERWYSGFEIPGRPGIADPSRIFEFPSVNPSDLLCLCQAISQQAKTDGILILRDRFWLPFLFEQLPGTIFLHFLAFGSPDSIQPGLFHWNNGCSTNITFCTPFREKKKSGWACYYDLFPTTDPRGDHSECYK